MKLTVIALQRTQNQQLGGTKLKSAVELVQWFGAVQAQEYAQSKWAIGLRLPHLTGSDIEKEFNEGKIIRTHLLRPTWHFAAAEDLHWLLELTAARVQAANKYMYKKTELDGKVFKSANALIIASLNGGRQLTRDEINIVFKNNGIEASGHRLSYIMMNAELEGIICSGARKGNQFTYALAEERVPEQKKILKDEALAGLAKKYFLSRGPATLNDFAAWSGLTVKECRSGLEANKNLFDKETVEGNDYYFKAGRASQRASIHNMYMLPIYDELIMGYKDRSAFFEYKNSVAPKTDLKYDCMIVCKGQVIGTWRRNPNKNSVEISTQFFKALNADRKKSFTRAVERLAAFYALPVK